MKILEFRQELFEGILENLGNLADTIGKLDVAAEKAGKIADTFGKVGQGLSGMATAISKQYGDKPTPSDIPDAQ